MSSMTYWEFKGRELVNCTCEYGCNCQFNALPDKGHCHAVVGIQIDQGYHGATPLGGLKIAAIFKWPGPIHEGHGEALAFVDASANEAQREALLKIMTGQDTDPFATVFAVFAATIKTMHEPLFADIQFEVDVEGRKGRLEIPGYVEMTGEPIRNNATGKESRAQIRIPDGFEYEVAEIGSGSSRTTGGPMPNGLSDKYDETEQPHLVT